MKWACVEKKIKLICICNRSLSCAADVVIELSQIGVDIGFRQQGIYSSLGDVRVIS